MSNRPGFFIQREDDRTIINAFVDICTEYQDMVTSLSIHLGTNNKIEFPRNHGFADVLKHSSILALMENSQYLVNTITIFLNQELIRFKRGELLENPSPLFDYVEFDHSNSSSGAPNAPLVLDKIKISSELQKKLTPVSTPKLISSNLPSEYEALLSQHNAMLRKLEELNSDLIIKSHEKSQELESSYLDKLRSLENKYDTKEKELTDSFELKVQQNEISKSLKDKELEVAIQSLKTRESQLDDRDNTHVRREIRDRMLDDVKNRINNFGVSQSTGRKRLPVLLGIVGLVVALSLLLFQATQEASIIHDNIYVSQNSAILKAEFAKTYNDQPSVSQPVDSKIQNLGYEKNDLYFVWVRIVFITFGLLGSILYYIKWQNRWAEEHSSSEFQLQQFYIDVNRANWVMESCLEWRKETDSVIPSPLLESITKNLFDQKDGDLEQVIHPADELASALLGSSSKLRMNIAGNELEIDKPGKIKPKKV